MDFEARKYNLGLDLEGDFWETGSGNEKCNVYKIRGKRSGRESYKVGTVQFSSVQSLSRVQLFATP